MILKVTHFCEKMNDKAGSTTETCHLNGAIIYRWGPSRHGRQTLKRLKDNCGVISKYDSLMDGNKKANRT